jgi:exodeoxyribonuclease-5
MDVSVQFWAEDANLEIDLVQREQSATADPLKTDPAGIIQRNRLLKRLRTQAEDAPIALLVFPGTAGAADIAAKARTRGIEVIEAPQDLPIASTDTDVPTAMWEHAADIPVALPAITLTPQQADAIAWIVARICNDEPLVALRGYAGSGKTTLIPALRAALEAENLPTTVGSPTHRAAMILRTKGIQDAETLHSQALIPYFTPDYVHAARWLHDPMTGQPIGVDPAHADVEGMPWLLHEAVKPDVQAARNLRRHGGRFKAKKLLASVGIHGKDHFLRFGPKQGEGVLLIDEASMVGATMLATCQEAFRQIVLIGDPGQLPPVKDTPMLQTVPGFDLTEIHRQAQDSPILQLATQAREGQPFWREVLRDTTAGPHTALLTVSQADASLFRDAPLLVWRNVTRLTCTHAIRQALGYAKQTLYPGEPLVCRSTAPEDRADGFFNNGLYRILEVFPEHPRRMVVEDALGETSTILAHLEELDGDRIPPEAIPFRFGYCLTTHTAQGGEWPLVAIALPDLLVKARTAEHYGGLEELKQWTYTALTRAKTQLLFLTQYTFTPPQETPMATPKTPPPSPEQAALLATPDPLREDSPLLASPVPDVEDIPEPVLPDAILTDIANPPPPTLSPLREDWLPMLQGFCQHLQHRLEDGVAEMNRQLLQTMDACCLSLKNMRDLAVEHNEHAQYQLSDALLKLHEQGLQLRQDPYQASVRAVSPQGFEVTLTLAKPDREALTTALPLVLEWMAAQGWVGVAQEVGR